MKLLLGAGARVNAADKEGRTALFYAVLGPRGGDGSFRGLRDKEAVTLLLQAGADVKVADHGRQTVLDLV